MQIQRNLLINEKTTFEWLDKIGKVMGGII